MATINFLYRSTKETANLSLRLLFRFNDTDFVFGANTQENVSKDYWTKQHKKKSKDILISNKQADLNSKLNKIENRILKTFDIVNPDEVTKDWLQTEINNYYNPPQQAKSVPIELIKYLDHYSDVKRNDVTENTVKKFNVIKQLLLRYQTKCKKKLMIIDVDANFKTDFEKYCESQSYAHNTIARAMRFIKTLCNHAKQNGIETSYQLDSIKVKYIKVDSIYLTPQELEKIETIEKSKLTDSLENAKDWLIISCYTGQRVSDFMRFTKEMIRYEKNKEGVLRPLIEFTQKKTGKDMTVPLHPKVMEILEKRNGEFPYKIADQNYNDYIKTVCRIAEITQLVQGSKRLETAPDSGIFRKETKQFQKCDLVSSHIGRRSFASNNYGTIPTSFLMYVTGHSTEAMFLTYIGKSNKDKAMEMTYYF
jgi:integrase